MTRFVPDGVTGTGATASMLGTRDLEEQDEKNRQDRTPDGFPLRWDSPN